MTAFTALHNQRIVIGEDAHLSKSGFVFDTRTYAERPGIIRNSKEMIYSRIDGRNVLTLSFEVYDIIPLSDQQEVE